MKNKLFEIDAALQSLNHIFDVLDFTETWFSCEQDVVALVGYKTEGVFQSHKKRSGTFLHLKDNLQYHALSEFSYVCKDYESIALKCLNTLVASVYRPPSCDVIKLVSYLHGIFEFACSLKLTVVFVGDFNIDVLSPNAQRQGFYDVVELFSCRKVIHSPNRITMNSETIIDLCITSHITTYVSPQLIMYADDTNIFFTSTNLASLESSVNDYMRRLSN